MLFTPGPVQPPYVAAPFVSGEARQLRQAGQPCRRERSRRRHRIGIGRRRSGEEVRHGESRRLSEKHDRNKWRLEAELIDRAHVFANVVDAVAAAQRGGVAPEHIPGKADARSPAGRDAVLERRSGSISGQPRNSQLVNATGIDERIRSRLR